MNPANVVYGAVQVGRGSTVHGSKPCCRHEQAEWYIKEECREKRKRAAVFVRGECPGRRSQA